MGGLDRTVPYREVLMSSCVDVIRSSNWEARRLPSIAQRPMTYFFLRQKLQLSCGLSRRRDNGVSRVNSSAEVSFSVLVAVVC